MECEAATGQWPTLLTAKDLWKTSIVEIMGLIPGGRDQAHGLTCARQPLYL
jgi:hypothetical protein